jgi:hypothetical protein
MLNETGWLWELEVVVFLFFCFLFSFFMCFFYRDMAFGVDGGFTTHYYFLRVFTKRTFTGWLAG